MGIVDVEVDGREEWSMSFRVLGGWVEKLVGLLGTRSDAMPVVLLRCSSIHSFGMRYPMDVAFVDAKGCVLLARRLVPPGNVLSCRDAYCVFERPAAGDRWFEAGDSVRLLSLSYPEEQRHREGSCYA